MAIDTANKRAVGEFLVNWIQQGIRTGARRAVEDYRKQMAAGNSEAAIRSLKRAVDLPHRARVRIQTWIAQYNARHGAGAGQAFISESLAIFGAGQADPVTLPELNADVSAMETYCSGLVSAAPAPYGSGSMTWEDIASDIEANVSWEVKEFRTFPLPAGYLDVWGE